MTARFASFNSDGHCFGCGFYDHHRHIYHDFCFFHDLFLHSLHLLGNHRDHRLGSHDCLGRSPREEHRDSLCDHVNLFDKNREGCRSHWIYRKEGKQVNISSGKEENRNNSLLSGKILHSPSSSTTVPAATGIESFWVIRTSGLGFLNANH